MDGIVTELGISAKNINPVSSPGLFEVIVHSSWLKRWLKNIDVNNSVNNMDFVSNHGESINSPWRKVFIRVRIFYSITILMKFSNIFHFNLYIFFNSL